MFKGPTLAQVSNVHDPKSFLDIFTLAFVNAWFDIGSDGKIYETRDTKEIVQQMKDRGMIHTLVLDDSYNIENDHKYYYKHLVDPTTAFKFIETDSQKRFFVACVFGTAYHNMKDTTTSISPFMSPKLASIVQEVINVPLDIQNNSSYVISGSNFYDLDLFDPEHKNAYISFFGKTPPRFLSPFYDSIPIKFKKVDDRAVIPTKKRRSDAGLDVTIVKKVKTDQWGNEWYDTGLQMEVPPGYYTELHGRSSLIKKGWQLANCTGIIDETYRNNLMCVFTRLHPDAPSLENDLPNRACQLVLRKHEFAVAQQVENLSNTDRDKGGFGSTGL